MRKKVCKVILDGKKYEAPNWLMIVGIIMLPVVLVIIGYIVIEVVSILGIGVLVALKYDSVKEWIGSLLTKKQT